MGKLTAENKKKILEYLDEINRKLEEVIDLLRQDRYEQALKRILEAIDLKYDLMDWIPGYEYAPGLVLDFEQLYSLNLCIEKWLLRLVIAINFAFRRPEFGLPTPEDFKELLEELELIIKRLEDLLNSNLISAKFRKALERLIKKLRRLRYYLRILARRGELSKFRLILLYWLLFRIRLWGVSALFECISDEIPFERLMYLLLNIDGDLSHGGFKYILELIEGEFQSRHLFPGRRKEIITTIERIHRQKKLLEDIIKDLPADDGGQKEE